jgi:hypothetical protein
MAVVFQPDPEDSKIGSKIKIINIVTEDQSITRTYLSYRYYMTELYSSTQENLKGRYRQGLQSHLGFEDWVANVNKLPPHSCRGLHLITTDWDKIKTIARNPYCKEYFHHPDSYIELSLTEARNCIKAEFKALYQPGLFRVIDLLGLLDKEHNPRNVQP